MIFDLIEHKGKRVGDEDGLTSQKIVDVVEKLNPTFSDGQEILYYDETKKAYGTIDQDMYEDALRMSNDEEYANAHNQSNTLPKENYYLSNKDLDKISEGETIDIITKDHRHIQIELDESVDVEEVYKDDSVVSDGYDQDKLIVGMIVGSVKNPFNDYKIEKITAKFIIVSNMDKNISIGTYRVRKDKKIFFPKESKKEDE